ncbi:MAG: electron transport complex subunit RsxD [Ectothiorhodospiraceae bacterium]|nr:electron transport complex subunit RsxD [Ectothiorhodospiraceae bacterium]
MTAPRFQPASAPHMPPAHNVSELMRRVVYALVPGTLGMVWLFGWGVLINIALAVTAALACEAVMLRLRGRPVQRFLRDWSAVVCAVLLALCLPPLVSWWVPVVGVVCGLVLGKHLYGGLGYNPFNPAMVGYAVLLVSFPGQMALWLDPMSSPGLLQSLQLVTTGQQTSGEALDALTRATPLDHVKTELAAGWSLSELSTGPVFGMLAGAGWEWINLLFLAGGIWLLRRRVIGWQIPVGVLLGLAVPALLFWLFNPDQFAVPLFHLLGGGTMLAAFFVATDPVSAATTPRGRLYYGAGIGILAYVIRTWGGYPDGLAFAVLLMNMAAPLIDHYTRPRIEGHARGREQDGD